MTKRKQPRVDCQECNDKGFVKYKRGKTWDVQPCPHCNPDGKDLEGEPS